MCEIKTAIVIDSNANKVWEILSNLSNFPKWNSFFSLITGKLAVGEVLQVTISPPNSKPMTFSPKLIEVNEAREIRWHSKLLCNWLFQGEHYFLLETLPEGKTKLIHGENFSGLLIPIFKLTALEKTKKGFEIFNQELKRAVEEGI